MARLAWQFVWAFGRWGQRRWFLQWDNVNTKQHRWIIKIHKSIDKCQDYLKTIWIVLQLMMNEWSQNSRQLALLLQPSPPWPWECYQLHSPGITVSTLHCIHNDGRKPEKRWHHRCVLWYGCTVLKLSMNHCLLLLAGRLLVEEILHTYITKQENC